MSGDNTSRLRQSRCNYKWPVLCITVHSLQQARSVRGGPGGRAPPAFCLAPPAFFLRRAFVHAWPPHGLGGPLLQNCHATGLVYSAVHDCINSRVPANLWTEVTHPLNIRSLVHSWDSCHRLDQFIPNIWIDQLILGFKFHYFQIKFKLQLDRGQNQVEISFNSSPDITLGISPATNSWASILINHTLVVWDIIIFSVYGPGLHCYLKFLFSFVLIY